MVGGIMCKQIVNTFFFSSRRRHTRSVSAFLLNRSSDLVMEAIKLCRLDTPIIFIEARINLSRFVVTGCAAKTSATVTFPSLNLISLFAFNQILKQNAKREMRLRLGKVTVADVLAAQPVTTNLLKFMRASIKMIGEIGRASCRETGEVRVRA